MYVKCPTLFPALLGMLITGLLFCTLFSSFIIFSLRITEEDADPHVEVDFGVVVEGVLGLLLFLALGSAVTTMDSLIW